MTLKSGCREHERASRFLDPGVTILQFVLRIIRPARSSAPPKGRTCTYGQMMDACESPMDAAGRSWHLPGRRITPIVLFLLPFVTSGSDWPQYRGANHDGSTQDRLIKQWSGSITNPIWKVPLTNGLCS